MKRLKDFFFVIAILTMISGAFFSCEKDASKVIVLVKSSADTIAPGGHVLYDIEAWTTVGSSISTLTITEMSDESGLTQKFSGGPYNQKMVKLSYDYQTEETQKDVSIFYMIFQAEDDLGNIQEYRRRLCVKRPEVSDDKPQSPEDSEDEGSL